MDEQAFGAFLKAKGKKIHVAAGLISEVQHFEQFLRSCEKGLDDASPQDLQEYLDQVGATASKRARAIALYYRFTGRSTMAAFAAEIREKAVQKTRQPFRLRDFRGVDQDCIKKLEAAGIHSSAQLLEAGRNRDSRQQLARAAGVPHEVVLALVKLADLSRLGGVKGIRARLYYDAGADTLDKMAAWEPEALCQMLGEFVAQTGFEGIAPLPKEVKNTVETARRLPRIVEY